MSDQPTDPQAADEAIDDLDVPADKADAVTGGLTFKSSDDEPGDETQGRMAAI